MNPRALVRHRLTTNAKGEAPPIHARCRLVAVWATDRETCVVSKNPPDLGVWADDVPLGVGDIIPPGADVWVELRGNGRGVYWAPQLDVEYE